MELTLKIPKRLVFRLRPHERQLDKILELGLDAFEAADRIASEPEDGDVFEEDIPASWRHAARTLTEDLVTASTLSAPSRAELIAYLEGDLEEADAESLRQRLLEHPNALEELLVMEDPHLDMPSTEDGDDGALGEMEVRQAWQQMQTRLASQQGQEAERRENTSPFPTSGSNASPRTASAKGLNPSSRFRPWLSLAAGVLLTTLSFAGSSIYHGRQAAAPQITHDIELNISRGGRSFQVSDDVSHVMLRIPRPASTVGQGPRILEVISPRGDSILSRQIDGWAEGGNSLHLILPRHQLEAGAHLLVIRDPSEDSARSIEEYPFRLEIP